MDVDDGVETLGEDAWLSVLVLDARVAQQLERRSVFTSQRVARLEAVYQQRFTSVTVVIQTVKHL